MLKKRKIKQLCRKSAPGQIMLIVILAITGIFVTGAAISLSITKELRRLGAVLDSVKAFYAADAGVEWQFYVLLKDPSEPRPELTNNTLCCRRKDIQLISPTTPGQAVKLKSIGTSPASGQAYKIKRSIETNTSW
ncbi:MAG: hypothetical protein AB1721_02655 [Patescibacteria group bacterium]